MYELFLIRGSEELVALPLDRDAYRIGRAPTNDLSVPEPMLSRHQCELIRDDGAWTLEDRSGKGTMVDGKLYTQTQLEPGKIIELGSLKMSLRHQPTQDDGQTASLGGTDIMPRDSDTTGRLTISASTESTVIKRTLNAPVLNIGSDPSNDIVLDEPFVSAFHCRIVRTDKGWLITDLGSTNGTRVDEVAIKEARLETGAEIKIGNVKLKVKGNADDRSKKQAGFFGMISEDPIMKPVFELIDRAAPTSETVLITGESGVGKELVARALHKLSRRRGRPMLPLNCSAITKDLLESELFGHEKGAFTGAQVRRRGLFEEADGGTILLDEIGELALDMQAKLLRVLENGEVRPVGSNNAINVDTRVLAATHRSLSQRVREGKFREDLYYRINVIEIAIPPLRKRPKDIPLLAEHFLSLLTRSTRPKKLSKAAMEKLKGYRFPGNVRELKHTITRAAILCPKNTIGSAHLTFKPPSLADRVAESKVYRQGKTLRQVEMDAIQQALESNEFNQKAAARNLGIARSTLIYKMERFGIMPNIADP